MMRTQGANTNNTQIILGSGLLRRSGSFDWGVSSFMALGCFVVAVWKAGVIAAERVQFAIRANDMRAAAVNTIFIPCHRIHERLNEKSERVGLVQFELFEQLAQRFGFAAAFHQILQPVANLVM